MKGRVQARRGRAIALVDALDGTVARALARDLARWASARGLCALAAERGISGSNGARRAADVHRHLPHLGAEPLRSLLAGEGRPSFGWLACDVPLTPDLVDALAGAYDFIACFSGPGGSSPSPEGLRSLPAVLVVEGRKAEEIAAARRFVSEGEEDDRAFPRGFVLLHAEGQMGPHLARQWRLPFWGRASELEHVAERLLELAVPLESEGGQTTPRLEPSPLDDAGIGAGADACRAAAEGAHPAVREILDRLRGEPDFKELRVSWSDREGWGRVRDRVALAARRLLREVPSFAPAPEEEERIIAQVVDDAVGFGPLEPLLKDPSITEVMVNGGGAVHIEREGRLLPAPCCFSDSGQLLAVIERMVAQAGRRVDESSPMVDARLPDGSRLNVVLPPLAVDGPAVTIRKFAVRMRRMEDAVRASMLTAEAASFLERCVRRRISIAVSGGTGSGKTTLLNLLAGAMDPDERIITIEDAAELSLAAPHVVRLEGRPAGIEGTGEISLRDLVRNALRMRPDRIVVGECRGTEALDMLQAMNTGHEGSLTTVHANSPRDALARLETMVLMAGMELPLKAVREQIVRAVRLVVQLARSSTGRRRVVEIAEVVGMEGETSCLQTIAVEDEEGRFAWTGVASSLA